MPTNRHLMKFQATIETSGIEEKWAGRNLRSWWNGVTSNAPSNLPSKQVTREELKHICRTDSGYTAKESVAAVMAWGGKFQKHGEIMFRRFHEIESIVSNLRERKCSQFEAYEAFDQLWKSNKPLGMVAAYFTKLIYFFDPAHTGYIMDQWTSKSVNLLAGKQIVHLSDGFVSKANTADNYRRFCTMIEALAKGLRVSSEDAEMAMFSNGGRRKGLWRQYVINSHKDV